MNDNVVPKHNVPKINTLLSEATIFPDILLTYIALRRHPRQADLHFLLWIEGRFGAIFF